MMLLSPEKQEMKEEKSRNQEMMIYVESDAVLTVLVDKDKSLLGLGLGLGLRLRLFRVI